jgi:hypothetical protein
MIIQREIKKHLQELSRQFPVVAVMGPRQSGKTTLVKDTFPDYAYVTMEDLDIRGAAKDDPRGFFDTYTNYSGVIIDEIQEAPELLSYMQGIVDKTYRPGFFIITGSQHFLMYEKITQTLAGRIALLTLLPLSVSELDAAGMRPDSLGALLLKGFYPRLYAQPIPVQTWYSNYISTYVEKDVRQTLKITDIISFQRFLKLCAARTGTMLSHAALARDADISPNTAKAWISILEASFIIKLLPPYYKNFNKRIVKSPKLYFYDSALVCSLLGIRTAEEISIHPLRGALVESFVISELFKYSYNHNEQPHIYFWRDAQGHEIDAIIEKSFDQTVPIEIKAGMTVNADFFKGLRDWQKITQQADNPAYIVYGGSENHVRQHGKVYAWHAIATMLKEIYIR